MVSIGVINNVCQELVYWHGRKQPWISMPADSTLYFKQLVRTAFYAPI
jgi:hypothetical protein